MRLEKLNEKESARDKLQNEIINDLVTDFGDIPESYWTSQEQIARDNGQSLELTEEHKDWLYEQISDQQFDSAAAWVEYLESDEGNLYPTWFKIYAFDGMSKMGTYNSKKKMYNKRSKGSVAPYPKLNQAALAKTMDVVYTVHEMNERLEDEDSDTEKAVTGGNFNKIYSKILSEMKTPIEALANPEDVRGEWREYGIDDIQELTGAAEGTPWCIAGESTARTYLEGDGAKFILLHLENQDKGTINEIANASIRMSRGQVSEISGVKGGSNQYLEDSLVPMVMEKVKSLPVGERYMLGFEDRKRLIEIDRKLQRDEFMDEEDIRFVFELDRGINYIDTYDKDERPGEFRMRFLQDFPESAMVVEDEEARAELLDRVAKEAGARWIFSNLSQLLKLGVDIDDLVSNISSYDITKNLPQLLEVGADIDNLVGEMNELHIAESLIQLLQAGAVIDIDKLIDELDSADIADNLTQFLGAGAGIDSLTDKMNSNDIVDNLVQILEAGADSYKLIDKLDSANIANNLTQFLGAGADVDNITDKMNSNDIAKNLTELLEAGAIIDVDELVGELDNGEIAKSLPQLLEAGATIDIDELVRKLSTHSFVNSISQLLEAGVTIDAVDVDRAVWRMDCYDIAKNLTGLLEAGATIDVDEVYKKVAYAYSYSAVIDFLPQFLKAGVDLDRVSWTTGIDIDTLREMARGIK